MSNNYLSFNDSHINKGYGKRTISNTKPEKYSQKNVSLSDSPLFFPDGFEHIFLAIYFMTLPYIAGLLFLFFYIADGDYNIFLSLNDTNSYILTWAIGYEILAAISLLMIMKSAISFSIQNTKKSNKKHFIIP